MRFVSAFRNSALVALTAFAALPALAQDAATPTAQAAAPTTVTDSKQVGDWMVRCFAVASESPCDMYQELQDNTLHQRVLSLSIAYVPSNDSNVMQIAVPLGIAVSKGLVIKTDTYQSPSLPFRRCDAAGCYVELPLGNDQVAGFVKSGPKATVNVVGDLDGKSYALNFSLNGFAGAHDAMAALAKQKATAAGGAAPAAPAKKR